MAERPNVGRWWTCTVPGDSRRPTRFHFVESDTYPDGHTVTLGHDAACVQIGQAGICVLDLDETGSVERVEVADSVAPKAPPLWYVEVREPNAQPPAVALLAFTGHGQQRGRLFDETAASNIAIDGTDQVGALRWYPATGETDQLYVQPDWRRRNIAASILIGAAAISEARGWPRIWGDGQRTQLGEAARNARSWRARTADLTHLAPPMTPPVANTVDDETGGHR